ncbi:hypothetical protein PW5551_10255 [Petrotoga sp. 9PW.55.5.1]|uniref:hypothetical protein n=1 Tax=Petrotoga sp. 9PW.55.5.1 TaxID=1308979 RepID=UPI000DC339AC|nr:hypothetical protein [Petrotoga sp. 9PW.55.5.1]RAO98372.1 hypothetical protein PW5551_10255 [Petrotoga sp. 9PW.55.5.1]
MKTKIKSLIIIFIILFSTLAFSIEANTTVPIYLEVPEYLKIAYIGSGSLAQGRLDLFATIENKNDWVSDDLDFIVQSNINYTLEMSFAVESSLTQNDQNHIRNAYTAKIEDQYNNEIITINKGHNNDSYQENPGISTYKLIFELFIKNPILQISGKIGDMYITVSSI